MTHSSSLDRLQVPLEALIREAESGVHVTIAREGKPVAMLLSIDEYHRLMEGRSTPKQHQQSASETTAVSNPQTRSEAEKRQQFEAFLALSKGATADLVDILERLEAEKNAAWETQYGSL